MTISEDSVKRLVEQFSQPLTVIAADVRERIIMQFQQQSEELNPPRANKSRQIYNTEQTKNIDQIAYVTT
ncbi:hypothetical protein N9996_01530 [Synechococcus sp. AH-603-M21]|nr:hypothetical protein [Synechococcus sp. AH-603-M21]